MAKQHKRKGGRYDGFRIRTADPVSVLIPFIMPTRTGASNNHYGSINIDIVERYNRQKRAEGYKGFGMLAFFMAAFVRIISQKPRINRFISGSRLYSRDYVEFSLAVKKEKTVEGQETIVKVHCSLTDTAAEVYQKLYDAIFEGKKLDDANSTEKYAKLLFRVPRVVLKFFITMMKVLDYFGKMPKAVHNASPFHTSIFVSDLASIDLPPINHHLYDFGTCSLFFNFGKKYSVDENDLNGETVSVKMIDYSMTMDERICDGFYFSGVLKMFNNIFKNPEQLDLPPEKVVEDVE